MKIQKTFIPQKEDEYFNFEIGMIKEVRNQILMVGYDDGLFSRQDFLISLEKALGRGAKIGLALNINAPPNALEELVCGKQNGEVVRYNSSIWTSMGYRTYDKHSVVIFDKKTDARPGRNDLIYREYNDGLLTNLMFRGLYEYIKRYK